MFRKQLELAAEARMPVVIHTRDAWDDTLACCANFGRRSACPASCTASPADAEQARSALDLGFILSFGGVSTFPKQPKSAKPPVSRPPTAC